MRIYVAACLLSGILAAASPAFAQSGGFYSGTGFYVSNQGYVVTNDHVVKSCESITVRGDQSEKPAKLIANDSTTDLALLKVDTIPGHVASLRKDDSSLTIGEKAMIMGYPREHGVSGKYKISAATIIDTKGPMGQEHWLQFSDVADLGNSGGPLLDKSGNVIGVVVGRGKLMRQNLLGARVETVQESSLAITLAALKQFLDDERIYYRSAESNIDLLPQTIENQAKFFIVNIHCIK